ncbi:MAG TPA: alpha/beta hydrolase [Stellaceae bacterium]|nr:alpha/beta hydrolase [Stellaceae bacterium]
MADEVAIAARFAVEARDLEYRREGGVVLSARLYRPKGEGPFPALVEVHGGAWASGDRLNNAPLDVALAKSGIVVLAIDFRMPPEWRYPHSIADIHYATRWLKAHAAEFGSRRDLVGGLGTSSGAHQLLLSALKPRDPRYAALPLAEAPAEEARLPYLALCWPIADPLARYRMVKEKGNTRLVESHDAYWAGEAEMAEGNPQLILDRGEAALPLPPAILVQGTADDNVTPDMADRFAAAWQAQGGRIELHKFAGQPHTFIPRDPASEAARRATELVRDFVLAEAGAA